MFNINDRKLIAIMEDNESSAIELETELQNLITPVMEEGSLSVESITYKPLTISTENFTDVVGKILNDADDGIGKLLGAYSKSVISYEKQIKELNTKLENAYNKAKNSLGNKQNSEITLNNRFAFKNGSIKSIDDLNKKVASDLDLLSNVSSVCESSFEDILKIDSKRFQSIFMRDTYREYFVERFENAMTKFFEPLVKAVHATVKTTNKNSTTISNPNFIGGWSANITFPNAAGSLKNEETKAAFEMAASTYLRYAARFTKEKTDISNEGNTIVVTKNDIDKLYKNAKSTIDFVESNCSGLLKTSKHASATYKATVIGNLINILAPITGGWITLFTTVFVKTIKFRLNKD